MSRRHGATRAAAASAALALACIARAPAARAGDGDAAAARPITIVTDAESWRGAAGPERGWSWREPGFDASGWAVAGEAPHPPHGNGPHYAAANILGLPSRAVWIWSGNALTCRLRTEVTVPARVARAEMLFCADDRAELTIDGKPLVEHSPELWGHRGAAELIDLVPFLEPGKTHVLAASVQNVGGPAGFVAEIRINGAPFVRPVAASADDPADEALRARLGAIVARLDDDDFAAREAAGEELARLLERHADALRAELRRLIAEHGSAEVRFRLEDALAALRTEGFGGPGDDGRLVYLPLPIELVERIVTGAPERPLTKLRTLIPLRALAEQDPAALADALRAGLDGSDDERRWRRVVGAAGLLELTELRETLREAARRFRDAPAGARAAAALGRIGTPEDLALLETVCDTTYAPTRRAALWAAARLREKGAGR